MEKMKRRAEISQVEKMKIRAEISQVEKMKIRAEDQLSGEDENKS